MTRPIAVALARAILEAAVLAAIVAVYVWLSTADLGDSWTHWTPLALLGLRTVEGWADEQIDPSKARGTLGRTLAGTTAVNGAGQRVAGDRGTAVNVTVLLLAAIVVILLIALF